MLLIMWSGEIVIIRKRTTTVVVVVVVRDFWRKDDYTIQMRWMLGREITLWHWYHIIPPLRIYCMTILLLMIKFQVIEKCCKWEIFKGYITDNLVCIEVCLKCTSTNISWDVLVPLLDDHPVWSPELVLAVEFSVQVLHCFWQAFAAHLQLLQVWNKQQKQ